MSDYVESTGNAEIDSANELNGLADTFKARNKREQERFTEATDSEFWIALCFRSRDSKEAFLSRCELLDVGDKYLDGHEVARRFGLGEL